jgi:periplasmic divalent cation tolerance protein
MSAQQIGLCTCPDEETAATLARTLVQERLAACVNIVPKIRSIYRWDKQICDDGEVLLIIKTASDRFAALTERLVAIHPYECPEVIALDICAGHPDYLAWVTAETRD